MLSWAIPRTRGSATRALAGTRPRLASARISKAPSAAASGSRTRSLTIPVLWPRGQAGSRTSTSIRTRLSSALEGPGLRTVALDRQLASTYAAIGQLHRRGIVSTATHRQPSVINASKHPFDSAGGMDGIRDPAAGPNSRPESGGDGSGSASGASSSNPSSPPSTSSLPGIGSSAGVDPSSSSTLESTPVLLGTTAPSTEGADSNPPPQPERKKRADTLRDPAAGPNSRPDMGAVSSSSATQPETPSSIVPPTSDGPSTTPAPAPTATPIPTDPPSTSEPPPDIDPAAATTLATVIPPVSLPEPVSKPPRHPHPFDTYAFISRLERAGIDSAPAKELMKGARGLLVGRSEEVLGKVLSTEDLDNWDYHFKAALSELRTEQSIRARTAGEALRSKATAMRREVDNVDQRMKGDLQDMRHEIEMDINDRKEQTRADMKRYDMATEELNNKFTIHLGDLQTAIEGVKWDSTRRAIAIIAGFVAFGVFLSSLYATVPAPAGPSPSPSPPAARGGSGGGMVDAATSTSTTADDGDTDTLLHGHEHVRHVDKHVDQLLHDWKAIPAPAPLSSGSGAGTERAV